MKTKENQTAKPRKGIRLDTATRDLAASLRDSITETDRTALEKDPEEAFIDLSNRFLKLLHGRGLTIAPLSTREEQMQLEFDKAAGRMLQIFTVWMKNNPGCSYDTRISPSGKFQVVMRSPQGTNVSFGGDVQDAYGQAAQTVQNYESTP